MSNALKRTMEDIANDLRKDIDTYEETRIESLVALSAKDKPKFLNALALIEKNIKKMEETYECASSSSSRYSWKVKIDNEKDVLKKVRKKT